VAGTVIVTGRERILAALDFRETDRVPIDFGGMRSTGIHAIAYHRLKAHLGLTGGHTRLYDIMQQLAEPEPEVLDLLGGDVVQLHRLRPAFGIAIDRWKPGALPDGSPCLEPAGFTPEREPGGDEVIRADGRVIARRPADGLYFEMAHFPLADATSASDIDACPWPLIDDAELAYLRENARRLRAPGDRAVLAAFGGNILEEGQFTWGWGRFMEELALRSELVRYYLDRLVENHLANLERYLPVVRDYVDIIQVGDDLGTQAAPQLSPDLYRALIKPCHRRVYTYIREHSDARVFLHSCGSIYRLIPDLIDAGVQILNPVQTSAAEMDPARLKREFGRDLVFWGGGCETQTTLPNGTIEEITAQARERLSIFTPGGGYVFNQIHNIQADVAPAKVVAMYRTAREWRLP
jgi:uroporphyrinogen decarboxylase